MKTNKLSPALQKEIADRELAHTAGFSSIEVMIAALVSDYARENRESGEFNIAIDIVHEALGRKVTEEEVDLIMQTWHAEID